MDQRVKYIPFESQKSACEHMDDMSLLITGKGFYRARSSAILDDDLIPVTRDYKISSQWEIDWSLKMQTKNDYSDPK